MGKTRYKNFISTLNAKYYDTINGINSIAIELNFTDLKKMSTVSSMWFGCIRPRWPDVWGIVISISRPVC